MAEEVHGSSPAIRRGPVLLIILASYTMIVLDISIVITALPKIHYSLGFSSTALSWVQNAYLLVFGGLLLLGARAGDVLGRRRMFIWGLALFTVASIGVGTAQSEIWLIAARAVQGVGAAILAPSTLAMLQTSFREGQSRPVRVQAPPIGGPITVAWSWSGQVGGGTTTERVLICRNSAWESVSLCGFLSSRML